MKLLHYWILPIRTVSEANTREHWTVQSQRKQIQKRWIRTAFLEERFDLPEKLHINLVRISPRKLDSDDNLPMAFKAIKDEIALCINPELKVVVLPKTIVDKHNKIRTKKGYINPGFADAGNLITWQYGQEKGRPKEYGVKIEIYEG